MDGTESGNIWQNSRKLCTVLNASPLLIPSVMHFSWNKQFSEVFGPGKTHFTFYWFFRSMGTVLKKITWEGDIFTLIATSFLFERIYWGSGVWIHNTIDRSNGKCGGWPKKKGSVAKSKCWISCHFYSPKPEWLRKVWLIEEREGEVALLQGGLLHTILVLLPQSGPIFMPEKTWHLPHYLQFSYYVSVD